MVVGVEAVLEGGGPGEAVGGVEQVLTETDDGFVITQISQD